MFCDIFASPPQPFEINVITPCGLIPIRNLTVLQCLYWDHVVDLAARFEGLSTKALKQSIMTATLVLKYFRNDIGIVAISCSHSGHTIKNFILQYIKSIHFKNVKETVDFDTSNLYARSCIVKFNLNRINVNISC